MTTKETGTLPSIKIENMGEFTQGLTILFTALQAYNRRVESPEHSRDTIFIQVKNNATEFKPGDIAYVRVLREGLAGSEQKHIDIYEATGAVEKPYWNCARIMWNEGNIFITPRPRRPKDRVSPSFSQDDKRGIKTSLYEFLFQRATINLLKTRDHKPIEVLSEKTDCLMRWVYQELDRQVSQTPDPLPTTV